MLCLAVIGLTRRIASSTSVFHSRVIGTLACISSRSLLCHRAVSSPSGAGATTAFYFSRRRLRNAIWGRRPEVLTGNYELTFGLILTALLALVTAWDLGWLARAAWAAAAVALCVLATKEIKDDRGNSVLRLRNFYGTLHVTQIHDDFYGADVRTLYHGIIEHGQQVFRVDLANTPTTYYGHASGLGLAIDLCCTRRPRRIGMIGLGSGTTAAYGRRGDVIRFYDINPAVPDIARNQFAFIRGSRGQVDIVQGDARVSMEAEPPQITTSSACRSRAMRSGHLITTEALDPYRRCHRSRGVPRSRYLNLGPVVQLLAEHAGMKAVLISNPDDTTIDVFASDWVVVTNNDDLLTVLEKSKDKEDITVPGGLRRWTDDYNSLLPILRRKRKGD